MSLTPLDIHNRIKQSEFYDRGRDIETALVWNALKKVLTTIHHEELFNYIKGVRISEKSITIVTGKPLINKELSMFRGVMCDYIRNTVVKWRDQDLHIIFR